MVKAHKSSFTVQTKKDDDGNSETLNLAVRKPTIKEVSDAQVHYYKAYNDAEKAGAPFRFQIDKILRARGEWGQAKDEEVEKVNKEISTLVKRLVKGGLTYSEGKRLSLEIQNKRNELLALTASRRSLERDTVESLAEQARFSYFVSVCTVYDDTGDPYFENLEDYNEPEDEVVTAEAAKRFGMFQYGLDPEYEQKLPENKFLIKHGFARVVNGMVRLLNDKKQLVDKDGRLVDEDLNYVDADGNRIDREGNRVTKDGEYVFDENTPFIDDR